MTQPSVAMKIDPHAPRVSFTALVGVECRKLIDTRSAIAILGAVGALAVLGAVIAMTIDDEPVFSGVVGLIVMLVSWLLPVVAILLVTTEWGQRSVVGALTVEPRRERVLASKAVATVLLGLGAYVVVLILAAVVSAVRSADFGSEASVIGGSLLALMFYLAMGFAFAVLLLNTPAAIVAYLVVPLVAFPTIVGLLQAETLMRWLNVITVLSPFTGEGPSISGEDVAHLLASAALWIVLPLAAGVYRVMTTEVK